MDFETLGLSQDLLKGIQEMGFTSPTPIQEQSIGPAIEGKDLIGQAQTGTGKTAAFGIPLIEKADTQSGDVQGLIIAPTRELAVQVAEELKQLGRFKGIRTLAVYGGEDIGRQIRGLKRRPHIISSTPGRLLDHIRRKTIQLDKVKMVVLDEADEMLNMGFIEDIQTILESVPDERQTLLFSATMPPEIRRLADRFMKNPIEIKVKAKTLTVDRINQRFLFMREREKFDVFTRLIDIQNPERAIVFGRTKRRVDELTAALRKKGYPAKGLHGDLTQNKRDQVMNDFKSKRVNILVATDVAARGIDISDISHVYNFDMPQDPESYVHRIGRTGRAGKKGMAVTFVTYPEKEHLYNVEKTIKTKIEQLPIPTEEEALKARQLTTLEALHKALESSKLNNYRSMAEELLNEAEAVDLLSAALMLATDEEDDKPIKLTSEPPLQVKRQRSGGHGGGGQRKRRPGGPYNSDQRKRFDRGDRRERHDRHERRDHSDRRPSGSGRRQPASRG